MQTRSETMALSHAVLSNHLILENIFTNLELIKCLPFRLISREWNSAILRKISEHKEADFSKNLNETLKTAQYFSLFKLRTVIVGHDKLGRAAHLNTSENRYKIFLEAMGKFGRRVKHFHMKYYIFEERELTELKTILSLMPNLEYLSVLAFTAVGKFWNVFNDFSHQKVKSLRFQCYYRGENSSEEFIKGVLKCFPNLETNFGQADLDLTLLEMLSSKKISMKKLKSFTRDFYSEKKFDKSYSLLSQLSPVEYKLTKLELWRIPEFDGKKAKMVSSILKNFVNTLTTVAISFDDKCKKVVELALPPLLQLRNLRLGMTFRYPDKMYLTYNLGKRMANDYPLLEYLTFQPEFAYPTNHDGHKAHWTSCKPWKAFAPFDEKADLSPWRFLKFVDLNIPVEWIEHEQNREWCQKFVDVFAKVYANVGKGNVQNIIDWLI